MGNYDDWKAYPTSKISHNRVKNSRSKNHYDGKRHKPTLISSLSNSLSLHALLKTIPFSEIQSGRSYQKPLFIL